MNDDLDRQLAALSGLDTPGADSHRAVAMAKARRRQQVGAGALALALVLGGGFAATQMIHGPQPGPSAPSPTATSVAPTPTPTGTSARTRNLRRATMVPVQTITLSPTEAPSSPAIPPIAKTCTVPFPASWKKAFAATEVGSPPFIQWVIAGSGKDVTHAPMYLHDAQNFTMLSWSPEGLKGPHIATGIVGGWVLQTAHEVALVNVDTLDSDGNSLQAWDPATRETTLIHEWDNHQAHAFAGAGQEGDKAFIVVMGEDGMDLWSYDVRRREYSILLKGSSSQPVVAHGVIYATNTQGVHAYDAKTLQPVGLPSLLANLGSPPSMSVSGDRMLVETPPDSKGKTYLLLVNLKSGDITNLGASQSMSGGVDYGFMRSQVGSRYAAASLNGKRVVLDMQTLAVAQAPAAAEPEGVDPDLPWFRAQEGYLRTGVGQPIEEAALPPLGTCR